jgi:hypothetical protein
MHGCALRIFGGNRAVQLFGTEPHQTVQRAQGPSIEINVPLVTFPVYWPSNMGRERTKRSQKAIGSKFVNIGFSEDCNEVKWSGARTELFAPFDRCYFVLMRMKRDNRANVVLKAIFEEPKTCLTCSRMR